MNVIDCIIKPCLKLAVSDLYAWLLLESALAIICLTCMHSRTAQDDTGAMTNS